MAVKKEPIPFGPPAIPLEIRNEFIALRQEILDLRKDVGVVAAVLRRVKDNQFADRDQLRTLFELHRDLRERIDLTLREDLRTG